MKKASAFYIDKLKVHYQSRLHKNPKYSLRAFSSYLGLAPQVISLIFQGKRHLPIKSARSVVDKLGLSPKEAQLFLADLSSVRTKLSHISISETAEVTLSEERHFRLIAEWEYYAVLNLLETKDVFTSENQIADRLGLDIKRAKFVLSDLISEKMVKKDQRGCFIRSINHLTTTKDIPSRALKIAHREALQLAEEKLEQTDIDARFYSASTISIDKLKLNAAKELMREFRQKMKHFMKEGETDEVYQFNMQFFPLSKNKDLNEKI